MREPIIYALAAMICYGLSDFIYKQAAAAGIRADHFLLAQSWFFGPLVLLYALATGTLQLIPATLWGSLAGAFAFGGFYFFIRSLTAGSVSINASVFRLNFVVTALLAIAILDEPMTAGKAAGLMLALLATWLLLATADAGDPVVRTRYRSPWQIVLATLSFGAANFFHTVGLRHGAVAESLAVTQAALFVPLATLVVYVADRALPPPIVTFRYGAAAAIVLAFATILLLRSIALGEASVLVPIAQMGFIVAALLGIFVLRERLTWRKAAGLAAALAALALLAAS